MENKNDRCGYSGYYLPRNNHKFLLNTMLHHVGMLWIIENHEELKYDMDIKNSGWLTGGTCYNTSICKKLHGNNFEGFITNAITDRYNIMCSIGAY